MSRCEITRRIEFDAGHRIPDHKSKCRNAHGHRYVLEATVEGPVQDELGRSDTGMVVDFGDLKTVMVDKVGDRWDHAFLVYAGDTKMIAALSQLGTNHHTVMLNYVPTVENLARLAFQMIDSALRESKSQFHLQRLRLYETPNCWSDVVAVGLKGERADGHGDRASIGDEDNAGQERGSASVSDTVDDGGNRVAG